MAAVRGSGFRCYQRLQLAIPAGLVGVVGPNGAGKTSLIEMVHFGCLGYSPRTSSEAEVLRFGAEAARVEVDVDVAGGRTDVAVGYRPGEPKRVRVGGVPQRSVERLLERFPVLVFTPDRLRLVQGPPALRRSYFDRVVTRLWPTRAVAGREYARALAQRNHLLRRVRAGVSPAAALDPWDDVLARTGAALGAARAAACDALAPRFAAAMAELEGRPGEEPLRYRAHTPGGAQALREALLARRRRDVERAGTGAGPHLDDVELLEDGRDVRRYGSQGEQRRALLALILAEADLLAEERDESPLLLLDDVTGEFDERRRSRLLAAVERYDQVVVTSTDERDLAGASGIVRVEAGRVLAA